MSSNYISESISLVRNLKKAANGDKLAAFCATGNVVKVANKLAKVDNSWGEAARGVVDSFSKASENSDSLKTAGLFIDVAKQGDEIGMCKSAVQVFQSSSPLRKGIEETLGWSAKFAAKHVMLHEVPKMVQNTKCLNSVAQKVGDFSKNTKGMGQLPALIFGVGYSLATIYAPKYARKAGGWICDKLGIKPYDEKKQA
ncbi:hypothetical protein IJ843_05165 [bacterium]|nr:hypothetical protein [bacterium]